MSFSRSYIPVIFCLALMCSCAQQGSDFRQVVPFAREIMDNPYSEQYRMLQSRDGRDRSGDIYIIGEEQECRKLSASFAVCDDRDNVDGSRRPDGLPDFSGEVITSIFDHVNAPYSDFLESGREDALREAVVKGCLAAIDTLCYLSPYDRNGIGWKSRAKVIVLASSYSLEYGLFDVDSLFSVTGCKVHVMNPLEVMKKRACEGNADAVVGVIAPIGRLSSGLYSGMYAFPRTEDSDSTELFDFLDRYLASGATRPLDALIIDDPSVNKAHVLSALNTVRSVMNEESYTYAGLLSGDFAVYDPCECVTDECYSRMRKSNLFTHKIAYPAEEFLMNVRSAEGNMDVVIPYNQKFVSGR